MIDVEVILPDDFSWTAHVKEVRAAGSLLLEGEHRRKDGTTFPVEINVRYVTVDQQDYMVAVARDITKRKQAEDELQLLVSQLRATLEATADGILVVDLVGRIVDCNQQFLTLWGFPREVLASRWNPDLIAEFNTNWPTPRMLEQIEDRERFVSRVTEIYRTPAASSFDLIAFQDGRTIELYSQPQWRDQEPVGRVWSFRDVTARLAAERQMAKLRDELSSVTRRNAIGELAAVIAHELNQPLTAVSNYAFSLHRMLEHVNASPLAERCLPLAEGIESQSLRAGEIIRRMEQLVRNHTTLPTRVDFPRLLDEVLALFDTEISQSETTIHCAIPTEITSVTVDAIQIQQVLINLIRNAMESMQAQSSPHRIDLSAVPLDDSWVVVRIRDWGPGVPSDAQDKIFLPFMTTKPRGMGFGLAISRRIIEAHGGKLWISPDVSPGAEFCCSLPVN